MLMDINTNILNNLLSYISHELVNKPTLNYGLLGGDLGKIIFTYCAQKRLGVSTEPSDKMLDKMFLSVPSNPILLSYCNGFAGMCHGLEWLASEHFIDLDNTTIASIVPILCEGINYYLLHRNIDFLHGSIGIARYLLSLYDSFGIVKSTIEQLINWLSDNLLLDNQGGGYWLFISKDNKPYQNISLSHGLSAIALFLCKAATLIDNRKCKEQIYYLLRKLSIHILSHIKNPDIYGCFTLSHSLEDSNIKYKSRLAWCYGDLGIAIALAEMGKCLDRSELSVLSHEIILYSSQKRLNPLENSVRDAGLCHGAFGIAMIYRYFAKVYLLDNLEEAIEYWEKVGKSFYTMINERYQFGSYSLESSSIKTNSVIIDGDAGVGLYLLNENSFLFKTLIYD